MALELEPHSKAKHEILQKYLEPWFPIISLRDDRIVYLDGFAGPGVYSKGEEGSPVLAIRTALNHKMRDRFKKIVFWFIEKDKETANTLENTLRDKFPELKNNPDDSVVYHVENTKFADAFERTLDKIEKDGAQLAPTFAFLDPFGFSGLPINLIRRMLKYQKCEVMITFMSGFVLRFHKLQNRALNELYGTNEWEEVNTLTDTEEKKKFLLNLYVKQLKTIAGATFVRTFEMVRENNQTIYHLVYGTKHWKGLEVIKQAMRNVGRGGEQRFSDRTDPNQACILDYAEDDYWIPNAAKLVFDKFKGKQVLLQTIHEFVITDTPYLFKKKILVYLESQSPKKILDISKRTRNRLLIILMVV